MTAPMQHISVAKITSNGQISLPAEIRKRWGVSRVAIVDRGSLAIVRALPDDPITYYRGRFKRDGLPSLDEQRSIQHRDDELAEQAKAQRVGLE